MTRLWKWIAIVLGLAFVCLLVFTLLIVSGVMDLGLSLI